MMRFCFIVAAVLAIGGNAEFHRSMQGMQGLSIICDTQEKLDLVHSYENHPHFDFLGITKILGREITVLVTGEFLNEFKTVLSDNAIEYTVSIDNVEEAVRKDYILNEIARRAASYRSPVDRPFTFFPRFSEIEVYLKDLATRYGDFVTLLNIGSSYEEKPIYVLKISSGPGDKPAVLIDAGIHAREWIAPSTALYAIHQLVVNKTNSGLYEKLDWYILPSLNPDGYEYTHTKQRLWRKSRSPNPGSICHGTDPNRNFDFKWMTIGASSNPCSETYAGKKGFSEKETASLRDFVLANNKTIKLYLTLHSYGQYLLHPWGYTTDLPANERDLFSVADAAEKALSSVRGTKYLIGSSTNVLYAAAGGSDDWVMAVGGVPLTYTIELPGGNGGFDPPPSTIVPVGVETFEAFKVFAKYIVNTYS